MPVTLESNRILIDTVEVETVKTHVPEVDIDIDIVPVITYPDTTTRNLQLAAESNTGVNGWRLVRFLPSNSGTWYSGNHFTSTNMEVTASLGTAYNYSNEFMVPFGTYDEIFFSTRNMQYWMHILKSNILGNYSDQSIDVISSSINPNNHTVPQQYNRSNIVLDPIITLTGYDANPRIFLYLEGSSGSVDTTLTDNGGMCVFVRTSTDTISRSIIPAMPVYTDTTHLIQQLAETATGVNGWRIVRFLPPNLGRWYAGNYFTSTNMEVTASLATGYDYTNEFMVPFGTYDEIMFSTRDMTYWLYTTKSSVLGNYSNSGRNVLKSSSNSNSHTVLWYNRSGTPEDPWISINNHTSNPNLMLYGENALTNSHTSLLSTNGGMCVFVRSSTDTVTVNPEPVYKTLTFEYNNEHIPAEGMAENATGVYGWSHVKHLNKNATQWYPDNTEEGRDFFTVADQVFDSHGSFTKPFPEHFDELLFTRSDGNGNVDRFVHCLKTDLETIIAYTNWTNNITSIQTHSGPLSRFMGFGRLSSYANRAPMIVSRNSTTNQGDYSVYEEHYQTTSANEGGPWWAPVANKQYDVYARMSIPVQTSYTVNFQAESECDILIVGGGGGGGATDAGGGGAGGLIYETGVKLNGEYTIKVGKGGVGGTGGTNVGNNPGLKGKNSQIQGGHVLVDYDAVGGGGGGSGYPSDIEPNPAGGGSSGGLGSGDTSRDAANIHVDGQGYSGGIGVTSGAGGGGGGGAGGPGGDGLSAVGGIGREIAITGFPTYYSGGGGGGHSPNKDGGLGGGGRGSQSGNGLDATFYGGGGGGGGGGWGAGGDGYEGIVIIRYKTKYIRQHPAYDAQWTYHSTNPNVHNYGNVGIGTLASETNKLTVKGDMNMIGNYKQNDVNLGNWYSSDNIHNIHRLTGNVGIGTTDPQYSVDTTGVLYASHGGFTGGTSTNWATSSDERIKDNITSASNETCYENVKNINLYKFNYKEQFANNKNETQYGFIAQEVQKYYPKAVKYEKIKVKDDTYENFLTINQTQLNYTLFGAVKHLQLELENIKVKLGMAVPVTEEPVTEETNTTEEPVVEEPVAEETNTTEEPVTEETNTTEEPVVEETNTTEEPVVEETNTTEEPVTEETNTTEEPVADETNTTEEPVTEETNTTEEPVADETNTTEEPVVEETNTT